MPSFSNVNDLSNYYRQQCLDVFKNEVAQKVMEILYEKTDELLYNRAFTPKNYTRTRDLINSINITDLKKISANTYEIDIYFDPNLINAMETDENEWNQHMSTDSYMTDESSNVIAYMEYGHGGLYNQKGIGMIKKARQQITNTKVLRNIFVQELKNKGFIVKT